MNWTVGGIFIILTFFPMAAIGSEPIMIEEIEIKEKPVKEEPFSLRSSFVTVIPQEEIENGFTTLPELLSEGVGVHVNRFGGLGDYSSISIRGSTSQQVLIYVDGMLLNEAQGGGINLGNLPVSHIESVEIYRGSSPIMLGTTGMGGVVHIHTKRPSKGQLNSIQFQYGSFNTRRFNGLISNKPNRWGYLLGFSTSASDNDFEFLDDQGTQFNNTDDQTEKRKNNEFRSMNVIGKLEYDSSPTTHIKLHHNYLMTDKGIPGIGSFQSLNANLRTWEYRTGLEVDHREILHTDADIRLSYNYRMKIEAFEDLHGEIGLANQDNKNKTTRHKGNVNLEYWMGSYQRLSGVWGIQSERFDPQNRLQELQEPSSQRQTISIGVEDQINLGDGSFLVIPSLLYERLKNNFRGDTFITQTGGDISNQDHDRYITWQLGALYRVNERLEIRSNIGQFYRPPNFNELFGDRGGVIGNVDLIPEQALNRDIGLRYKIPFSGFVKLLNLEAVYFRNNYENMIIYIQNSQRTTKPENIDESQVTGFEISLGLASRSWIKTNLHYTFQRAVNRSEIPSWKGNILPGHPVHELSGQIQLLWNIVLVFYSFDYIGENYLDQANQRETNSRSIHNIGISFPSFKPISITFEIKNITDNQIEDIFGFPLPGRSYYITLQSQF